MKSIGLRGTISTALALAVLSSLSCARRPATSDGPERAVPDVRASVREAPRGALLRYVQIEVGQGDAELVVSPDGHAMLVDGGPPGRADEILAALREAEVERLDYAVASHPHNDHIGSLDEVVRAIPVEQFLDSGYVHGSDAQGHLLKAIKERGVRFTLARPGGSHPLGAEVSVTVLAPHEPLIAGKDKANDNSVVLKVTYHDVRFLLTGDLEEAGRERLYEQNADLGAEVLKVAHHGSHNGTDREFLERVRPRVALLSCEIGNDYGHPHVEVLEALSSAGVTLFRTDLQGTLTLTTDGRTWQVATARQAELPLTTPGRKIPEPTRDGAAPDRKRVETSPRGDMDRSPSGKVVGNRRSKVYHVGTGAPLPAPENRVYFKTVAEAQAAGYRPASGSLGEGGR